MDRQELESIRQREAAKIKRICADYGLYGNVIYYEPSPIANSSRNRLYIVAGTDPMFGKNPPVRDLYPEEIMRQINRDKEMFYPNLWVFDLFSNRDEVQAIQDLVDYCKKAEVIKQLYEGYGLPVPEKLRVSEVNQLIKYTDGLNNPRAGEKMRELCKRDLDWFFQREKSSGFRRKWLDYFRSGRFPDEKGPLAKIHGYFHHKENKVPLDQLMENTENVRKLEMQEYEYKLFTKFIKDCYPDVIYAAGEKEIVDHGLIGKHSSAIGLSGQAVTAEEYAVRRKERFAREGWDALSDITPAYWEFRDVYYKAVDEPLVASAYNSIVLQYAKSDPLIELQERGELCLQKIPASDFMNFVCLAKENKLRFYIDNLGDYAVPSLTTINVLYNKYQEEKMHGIMERMVQDKVNYSHVLDTMNHPRLNSVIQTIEENNKSTDPLLRDRSIDLQH